MGRPFLCLMFTMFSCETGIVSEVEAIVLNAWQRTIADRLQDHAGYSVDFDATCCAVRCENEDSFAVSICEHDRGFFVRFDGWHEEFTDVDEALNCFGFGLSDECRLNVKVRGGHDCAWTVQYKADGMWRDDSTTGLIFTRFWAPARVEYRVNHLKRDPEQT